MSNLPNNLPVEITYYLEIPIKVTCTVSKGYPMPYDQSEPGCPDEIEDISYSYDIEKVIEKESHLIAEQIWEEVKK